MLMYQLIFWHALYQQEIASAKLSRLRSEEEAFEYAEFWILTNPEDVVMLVEVELEICQHCKLPIQEKPGWILHRWIHIGSQAHICWTAGLTQAEPERR